ncbi:hypothetical protein COW36_10740 [bacterium (Candidatus Blackallbacteria) CG17_big_fil_post_rev_8_21_14_2_50_48_46]|uniref:Response regulatory domain-containing protein n=1 Tax=bacterium (Candidatus Blackallbacteria) CG17_big_fil_post_rev_8_21_14_2_50_48_46 TaxID=2014261 RepID=A0A2M7G4U2_9BACT|nr:MAG: hypothetical protein COW64_20580 [bacterium (Candidatus Blackallbacteria) CG18_big_fil_WC_8_21_14_2_50_49_26]PIW16944.1 MAG: hypothetical protein COW36_10740 [bacterium (Candidatus Blackallbacteria) CG17_big_fil_post_rev_8_21_14_2_50_48_46]PIW50222.1 MAG: hypothetical protein COW20_03250 [bacterium (Candidatus Blackallbacteria) CG13_big_fil_rev_8_21_14_2_50_49_14]
MEHILIVEDHPDTGILIDRFLHQAGYQVSLASSGIEGLKILRKEAIDLVLLDIQLPDITGMEVLALLKAQPQSPPVIMLTASSGELAEAFALGAQDYVLKPFNKRELLARVSSIINTQRHLRAIKKLNQALQADRELAGQVQRLFLPKLTQDPAVQIGYTYLPLETVSGDLLDIKKLESGNYLFYLGDVSGHGVHAALLVAAIKTHLDTLFEAGETQPWQIMRGLALHMNPLLKQHYLTLILGHLNLQTGKLTLCNAGHPPGLLLRQGQVQLLDQPDKGAMPIGIQPIETIHPEMETHWQLRTEDRLLLCSDGLFEHQISEVSAFTRLTQRAAEHAALSPEALCRELPERMRGQGFQDDVSLLAIGFQMRVRKNSIPASLSQVEAEMYALTDWLQAQELAFNSQEIALAWLEYANNLVIHGQTQTIDLEASISAESLELKIRDFGPDWELPPCPEAIDPMQDSGRGLWLIDKLCQSFEVKREGGSNLAVMLFSRVQEKVALKG